MQSVKHGQHGSQCMRASQHASCSREVHTCGRLHASLADRFPVTINSLGTTDGTSLARSLASATT